MSQNIPPNQTGQNEQSNPYAQNQVPSSYEYQQASAAPDLDANAPSLKSNELQRLNRKALVFLAGIVLLLLVMAAVLFNQATAPEEKGVKPREEMVVIPELPTQRAVTQQAEPIPLAEPILVAPPQLPPPPSNNDYAGTSSAPVTTEPYVPTGPTLAQRRMGVDPNAPAPMDPMMQALIAQASGQANPASQPVGKSESGAAGSAQFLNNADSLLVRGTYIRCVLETRIITDIPGFTSCIVTEPVYSINGRRLLLPKGSKVSGKYDTEDPKIPRVSVIWDRITTPNGIDVTMASPGIDNLGGAGHPGDYNAHWASKLSSALFISLVSDVFKYAGEKYGPQTQTVTTGGEIVTQPFDSNTAQTVERMANQVVQRNMARPATVTINQGTVVNIYVAKDVSFAGVVAR